MMATERIRAVGVPRGKTAGVPFHQRRQPRPIAQLSASSIELIAQRVQAHVSSVARSRGCCCYVFVRDGQVYVLSEESSMAHRWAVTLTAEWVGCYGGMPDLQSLGDDLREMLTIR
jgi:hypothetical protein